MFRTIRLAGLREDIITRGAPAVRYKGKIFGGRRGETHADIAFKNSLPGRSHCERGYILDSNRRFIPASDLETDIDSSELMSNLQRMRIDYDRAREWASS